jgi:hypothetical protein
MMRVGWEAVRIQMFFCYAYNDVNRGGIYILFYQFYVPARAYKCARSSISS